MSLWANGTPMTETERAISASIGYQAVEVSIDGHPSIKRTFRTASDRDSLVERISPIVDWMLNAARWTAWNDAADSHIAAGAPDGIENPHLDPDFHEYGDSYSGMCCGAMVMRDGGGDQCGLSSDHPIHRGWTTRSVA